MGYTTEFYGKVTIDPPLSEAEVNAINAFAEERHGGSFHADPGFPGLYCQWVATSDGSALEWDGGEKFYESEGWMAYVIDHFIAPAGHVANGTIEAQGEDHDDRWLLVVEDNVVLTKTGRVVYD